MKKLIIGIITIALLAVGTTTVLANRSFFVGGPSTSVATSTVTSLGTGQSTTLILDSFNSIPAAVDSTTLLLQFTASTSASVLHIVPSYSMDGVDYYENNITATSSTSNSITVGNFWTLQGNAVSSTTRKAVSIPTPTRYIRVTFTAVTGTSSIWATFATLREGSN
jgi:hypothetical protein